MIRLEQLRIPLDPRCARDPLPPLKKKAAALLGVKEGNLQEIRLVRHSIDARRKPQLFDTWTVDVTLTDPVREKRILAAGKPDKVNSTPISAAYVLPEHGQEKLHCPPIIAGGGPAGLFCALMLAYAGYRPVLLERGDDTAVRDEAVRRFWAGGALDPESNIQFGLGGAGAYSDGKLTTGVRDPAGRGRRVLELLTEMGAPEDILYEAYPHVGTDVLRGVVGNLKKSIEYAGGEVRLRECLLDISCTTEGRLTGIVTTAEELPAQVLVLAVGHSARDTVMTLHRAGVAMEQKAFAVGLRVAHPQTLIDRAQYGISVPEGADRAALPPAIYRLTARTPAGRGVYSFCMCPGGRIVNASSEPEMLCVNGMSERARAGEYANSAIVVTVETQDYDRNGDPTDGILFQRELERRAFSAGGGGIPVSWYGDFVKTTGGSLRDSAALSDASLPAGDPEKAFCGRICYTDLTRILPGELNEAVICGMESFGRRLRGFSDGRTALLAGIESRTSSPVRILRGDDGQSLSHSGLYPCGEGAGFAGGIMSAAMDGIRTAEKIIARFAP